MVKDAGRKSSLARSTALCESNDVVRVDPAHGVVELGPHFRITIGFVAEIAIAISIMLTALWASIDIVLFVCASSVGDD